MQRKLEDILNVSVERDSILSGNGDITVVFKASYPEGLTRSNEEYEALNQGRIKAIKSLPNRTVFLQQDVFRKKTFRPENKSDQSFLAQASDHFFSGRNYYEHECYISITLQPANRKAASSAFCSLLNNSIVPAQTISPVALQAWEAQVSQFKRLFQEAGIPLQRLTSDELISSKNKAGVIEKYLFQLPSEKELLIKDIDFDGQVKVGNDLCQFFTLAQSESFPDYCSARITHDAYSTDKTSFPVGYASHAGMLLFTDHIYNQFIVLGDTNETRQRLERKNKRLFALTKYSRENSLAHGATNEYLNEMLSDSKRPCSVHYNVMTIAADDTQAKEQVNQTMAAFSTMDAVAKQETVSAPQLYWAGIPGNAADIPKDHMIETFVEQASCFLSSDSVYGNDAKGIRFEERITGRPVNVDLFDEPMERAVTTNRNMFVCGSSGGGKSMTVNHILRTLLDEGAHCVIVDIGGSYMGLCALMNGYYFTYTEEKPIEFNPFYIPEGDILDTEKKESLKALLVSLWKAETETFNRAEYVALSNAIQGYYAWMNNGREDFPCFNSFYEYLQTAYTEELRVHNVKEKDFDINNFLYVLRPYYKGGEFDYLLNAKEKLDMLNQHCVVFELDNIKDHPILFPVVTMIIMELFMSKLRKRKEIRKVICIDEAWVAIAKAGMAQFIKYAFKTVRKHDGIAAVVTQEVDDLISSPVIKEAIINTSDIKILMDMRKFMNKFDALQNVLGLTEKAKTILLSVNRNNDPTKKYREVFIDLNGQRTKVYRNELSPEEYYTYTTEQKEKLLVASYAEKYGDMKLGIKMLINDQKK